MLDIKNLCFLNIINNIDFDMSSGEFLGIIGKNGSGKSTVLKCIAGINSEYTGAINLGSNNIKDVSRKEIAKRLCYIPQKTIINYDISVKDFLFFSRYAYGENIENSLKRIEDALEMAGMLEFKDKNCRNLSGGEFQKVMLCSAIVQDSDIWILDEPASNLDPAAEIELFDTLNTIRKNKKISIILVSHNLNIVLNKCDRLLALKEGKVLYDESVDFFHNSDILKNIYGINFYIKKQKGILCFPEKTS